MTTVNNDNRANMSIVGRSVLSRIKKSVFKADYGLLCILSVYVIVGYLLMPNYQYKLDGDSISYMSIAQKYFDGAYSEAVNAYWHPEWRLFQYAFLLIQRYDSPVSHYRLRSAA